jgi:hypothetical protein
MIERYATASGWAKWFEQKGVASISEEAIRHRLEKAKKVGLSVRDRLGRIFQNCNFSERDVREVCADLLSPMSQADGSGFFVLDGIRYGSVGSWFVELGLNQQSVGLRLQAIRGKSLLGKDGNGHIHGYYPEPDVLWVCADLLRESPQSDKTGFLVQDGVHYGTMAAWSRKLGISKSSVPRCLKSMSAVPLKGWGPSGRLENFFDESIVRSACADFIRPLPEADDKGFFLQGAVRCGTAKAWSNELGFSDITIRHRLNATASPKVRGKNSIGRIFDFYPEPAVREACRDLIEKKSNPTDR